MFHEAAGPMPGGRGSRGIVDKQEAGRSVGRSGAQTRETGHEKNGMGWDRMGWRLARIVAGVAGRGWPGGCFWPGPALPCLPVYTRRTVQMMHVHMHARLACPCTSTSFVQSSPAWGNSYSWSQRRHPVITAAKSVLEAAGAAQPRTALATERLARPQLYLRTSRHEPCIKVHRFHDPFRLLLLLAVAC